MTDLAQSVCCMFFSDEGIREVCVTRSGRRSLKEYVDDIRASLGRRAYSQEGEDLILARYFDSRENGFFVDVGAHHPHRFSNTYLLYRRGWHGVNIDAMPGSMHRFRTARPRDINIEAAIGLANASATYFMFNEPALNTFDPVLAAERTVPPWRLIEKIFMPVRRLEDILSEVVPRDQRIDLLTIDVEGRDLEVLQSNDWNRFRPAMVLAETRGQGTGELRDDPVTSYLTDLGYVMTAKTFNTSFMMDAKKVVNGRP